MHRPRPRQLDCTLNHVSDIEVTKTSSPKSGGKVDIGDTITYTLTFHNVSTDPNAAPAPVDQVDHLDDVLDDASWATGPTASTSDLTATRTGDQLHVTGSLASGQTVTVTYKVKVHGKGNRKVRNVVGPAGEAPVCAADSPTCTSQGIRPQDDTGDGGGRPRPRQRPPARRPARHRLLGPPVAAAPRGALPPARGGAHPAQPEGVPVAAAGPDQPGPASCPRAYVVHHPEAHHDRLGGHAQC